MGSKGTNIVRNDTASRLWWLRSGIVCWWSRWRVGRVEVARRLCLADHASVDDVTRLPGGAGDALHAHRDLARRAANQRWLLRHLPPSSSLFWNTEGWGSKTQKSRRGNSGFGPSARTQPAFCRPDIREVRGSFAVERGDRRRIPWSTCAARSHAHQDRAPPAPP